MSMEDEKVKIFTQLRSILSTFVPPLEVRGESDSKYNLYGTKKVTVGKKEVDGMYFASAIIQKNFVGFYFFPIYTHLRHFSDIPQDLKKCLKGKSCFHIKKSEDNLFASIRNISKKGMGIYRKDEWI